jgi:hypothetical protein
VLGLGVGAVASTTAASPQALISSLAPISTANQVIDGITGGGSPWVMDQGSAILSGDGRLFVNVNHLVLASNHTNPVQTGRAIVTCVGQLPATTGTVPFSAEGNATVIATVRLASPCLAPTVFFAAVTAGGDRWLAVTGTTGF